MKTYSLSLQNKNQKIAHSLGKIKIGLLNVTHTRHICHEEVAHMVLQ